VSTFAIGTGGALTAVGTPVTSGASTTSGPGGLAVSPDGQYLFVPNEYLGTVSTFSIGPDGAPTQQGTGVISGVNAMSGAYWLVTAPNQGPTASFSATPATPGSSTTFNARASTPGTDPIATYEWQFGDGATATGASVSHAFAKAGTYTVTLTVSDTDGCSVLGPFVGHSPYCVSDPGASTTRTVTIANPVKPGKPTLSSGSIAGVAKRKPKLSFTVTAGKSAPALSTVAVHLPGGLSFAATKRSLAKGIAVNGKHSGFTYTVKHGTLTIKLKSTESKVKVTIAGPGPGLAATATLAGKVKHHEVGKLRFAITATDAHHTSTSLALKLSPH
jgi:hypothetical protein